MSHGRVEGAVHGLVCASRPSPRAAGSRGGRLRRHGTRAAPAPRPPSRKARLVLRNATLQDEGQTVTVSLGEDGAAAYSLQGEAHVPHGFGKMHTHDARGFHRGQR